MAESGIWSAAGFALALAAASSPSLIAATHGVRRLAAVIVYALSLSFVVAASLGSQHAGRQSHDAEAADATDKRQRLEAAYAGARDALAAMPSTRPVAAIEAELTPLLARPDLQSCDGWLASKTLRALCIERVIPLKTELANVRERDRQSTAMAEANAALADLEPPKPANADAAAIGRYLALVGLAPSAESVADALNALTVAAVEVCAGLALMLGRAPAVPESGSPAASGGSADHTRLPKWLFHNTERERNAAIVERLKVGALTGSQRAIAAELGEPPTSLRNAVERDPRLRLTASRDGSRLELIS